MVPHLVRRFFFSLRPGSPDPADEAWFIGLLHGPEAALYQAQSAVDRIHSLRCARHTAREVAGWVDADAAALIVASGLHDVGKTEVGLGTAWRVVSAVLQRVAPARLQGWAARPIGDLRERLAVYAEHDAHGADLLSEAGSAAVVVTWAREHHLPSSASTMDRRTFEVLARADHA